MERNSHEGCELLICDNYSANDGNYTKFFALDQQEKIIEAARILNSFGKQFIHGPTLPEEIYYSASYEHSSGFQSVLETVDGLIEWLERSGNDVAENLKKKEAILRGVLRLTGALKCSRMAIDTPGGNLTLLMLILVLFLLTWYY